MVLEFNLGGMPGAENLRDSVELKELSLRQEKDNKLIGKILMSMMMMSTMTMTMTMMTMVITMVLINN